MTPEQHKAECLERWEALKAETLTKWGLFRRKRISRGQLEQWLKQQSEMDERTIRAMFNGMRSR
ncbi:hypothetical protein [Marinobacter nauticus]|uniref:hypothetical protein n=1 Tax=Marinobacter nauticus TaxID=2743 RepID=UPI001C937ACD|nr:hypothetical protein [Marinobacter nauticus]MBY6102317.1 hypothetical protein [Marinobacter nauticus]